MLTEEKKKKNNLAYLSKQCLPSPSTIAFCEYVIPLFCSYFSIKDLFEVVALNVVVCHSVHPLAQIAVLVNVHCNELLV